MSTEWEASLAKGRAIVAAEVEKSREVDQAFAAYLASKLNAPTVPDAFAAGFRAGREKPIDMVLHCPKCGMQHIDRDEGQHIAPHESPTLWRNPPHRSHLCHKCGFQWRPADVATNGVAAIKTKGKDDSPIVQPRRVAELVDAVQEQIDHAHMNDTRTVPQFGKVEGAVAVRAEYLDAVLSRFRTP